MAIALVTTAIALGLAKVGAWVGPELWIYDHAVGWLAASSPSRYVTIIGITETDLARFGDPVDDATIAQALRMAAAADAAAVGLDLYRDRPAGNGRADLALVARAHPNVTFVERLPDATHRGVAAPEFLEGDAQIGFADVLLDDDGVVRRGLLYLWDERDRPHISFALHLASQALEREGIAVGSDPNRPEAIRIGRATVAPLEAGEGGYESLDAAGYQFLLHPAHRQTRFFSLTDLVDGRVPADALAGRIVIVGMVAESMSDLFATPLRTVRAAPLMPGVEVHAHAADQLVRLGRGESAPIRGAPDAIELATVAALSFAGAFIAGALRSPWMLASAVASGLALLAALGVLVLGAGYWLPMVPSAIAWVGGLGLAVAASARRVRGERAQLMRIFGSHVSPQVAELLWRRRDELIENGKLRPERRVVTVLMADLAGFSRAAAVLSPESLMTWIDACMAALADCAGHHGGIVDDYFGDGVKVDFGLPLAVAEGDSAEQDARSAVRCALAMESALGELAARFSSDGMPGLRLRVGIATGEAIVGSMGSADRLKYTAIGMVANIAARLESMDREGFAIEDGQALARILIAESTRMHLGAAFLLEDLGLQSLKGLAEPERIYRVRDTREDSQEST